MFWNVGIRADTRDSPAKRIFAYAPAEASRDAPIGGFMAGNLHLEWTPPITVERREFGTCRKLKVIEMPCKSQLALDPELLYPGAKSPLSFRRQSRTAGDARRWPGVKAQTEVSGAIPS